jgi:hypothetical protein
LPGVDLTTVRPDGYAQFDRYDLTVFHRWLPEAWPAGSVLVIDPPSNFPLLPADDPEPVAALSHHPADPLLADVDLSRVRFGSAVRIEPSGGLSPVLSDANGLGLVWHGTAGSTRLVVFSFRLADSNITRRVDFPILVANAVAALLTGDLPSTVAPGESIALPPAQLFPALSLTMPDGQVLSFGADRPALFTDTRLPGLYVLQGQAAGGETWQSGFGVNAGTPEESELRRTARPEFAGIPTTGGPLGERAATLDLWPWVVGAVLLVLLVEAWLAWR